MFESLEARRLLAVTATFSSGVLTVTSDDASDHVRITSTHGDIFVFAGHHLVTALHDADAIVVNLNGGDDLLETASSIHAPMTIHGGAGNDHLQAGSGQDHIFGDEGDDSINSADGVADNVDGGPGIDSAVVDHVDVVVNVEHIHFHHHHHATARIFDEMQDDLS